MNRGLDIVCEKGNEYRQLETVFCVQNSISS